MKVESYIDERVKKINDANEIQVYRDWFAQDVWEHEREVLMPITFAVSLHSDEDYDEFLRCDGEQVLLETWLETNIDQYPEIGGMFDCSWIRYLLTMEYDDHPRHGDY